MKKILSALAVIALLTGAALAEDLTVGAKGDDVQQLQQALIEQGYLTGDADGAFGSRTAEAVRAFQTAQGLEITGIADDDTQSLILSATDETRTVQQVLIDMGYLSGKADGVFGEKTIAALKSFQTEHGLSAAGEIDEATTAAINEIIEDHKNIQQALVDLGYELTVDGFFGSQTAAAVEAFERDHGLAATGVITEDLRATIFGAAENFRRSTEAQQRLIYLGYLTGEADGMFGAQSSEALKLFQQANNLPADGELNDETYEKLMAEDAQGDEVRMAQARLIELGYLTGKVDGQFGPASRAATKLFQKMHSLEATGEVNDETWAVLFSEDAKQVRPALERDDRGTEVKELQTRLSQLGFLTDTADGVYGKNTESAVRAFQNHLDKQSLLREEISGKADSLTQETLFDVNYSSYLRDLTPGMEDDEVLRAERRLRGLGYMDAEADTNYDDYAVESLKAFQSDAGIDASGTVDQATSDALFSAEAEKAAFYIPHTVERGASGGVVKNVQNVMIRYGMLSGSADGSYGGNLEAALERFYDYLVERGSEFAPLFEQRDVLSAEAQWALIENDLFSYAEDVKPGTSKSEILRLQRRLAGMYFMTNGGIDGDCGPATVNAIKKFQEKNGLNVTGVADEATQRVLYSDEAIGNWTRYKLEVSTANQRVYVYELNEKNQYEHIDTFICSTGLGNSTPTGVFMNTTEPLNRWHYFTKYECWAQYAYRITGPYYFHSVIYSTNHESSIRMGSVYALGSKASHGCIRLRVEDARWIYQNCKAGTIVVIY